MSVRAWSYPVVLTLAAVFGSFAAQDAQAAGDAARGKTLGYTCLGCHGLDGYKNAYPTYSVPKLSGQHPGYIVQALKAYKSGERGHSTMHAQASTLSDQDMEDIAAYFAGTPVKTAPGAPGTGDAPTVVNTVCSACHGKDGVGIMDTYPILSGQHSDYIERALTDYRSGARRNGIMAAFAGQLKPEEIKLVAKYFAKQKPALETLARPQFKLTAPAK